MVLGYLILISMFGFRLYNIPTFLTPLNTQLLGARCYHCRSLTSNLGRTRSLTKILLGPDHANTWGRGNCESCRPGQKFSYQLLQVRQSVIVIDIVCPSVRP